MTQTTMIVHWWRALALTGIVPAVWLIVTFSPVTPVLWVVFVIGVLSILGETLRSARGARLMADVIAGVPVERRRLAWSSAGGDPGRRSPTRHGNRCESR